MAYALTYDLQGAPDWQVSSNRRLRMSMLLAALFIAACLSVIRMPVASSPVPIAELVVRLIERVTAPAVEEELQAETKPQTDTNPEPTPAPQAEREANQPGEIVPVPREAVERESIWFPQIEVQVVEDWREFGAEVIREFIANLQQEYTVNPVFDENRRIAAIKFRPSTATPRRQPWDNVEKDQLNRTILNLGGGCFRVLDDPSVVYRDVFETYTQYIVQCTLTFGKPKPRELPWVEEVRDRFGYLRRINEQRRDPNAF